MLGEADRRDIEELVENFYPEAVFQARMAATVAELDFEEIRLRWLRWRVALAKLNENPASG